MKILSIGDIHGRDQWKFLTHGSPHEYNLWRTTCENGAPADDNFWKEMPYMAFDKIVFVGDYVDSFTVSNIDIKSNLLDIIDFKQRLGDRVILLLGNHDVQYIVKDQICSGFRAEAQHDLSQIFRDNLKLFAAAYQFGNHLWTHAGVTKGWLEGLKKRLTDPNYRYSTIVEERAPADISEWVNLAWELKCGDFFAVDRYSGGYAEWAGPIWVRPQILNQQWITRIHQIVGHTPQKTVVMKEIADDTKHYFIDCIEHGETQALELDLV